MATSLWAIVPVLLYLASSVAGDCAELTFSVKESNSTDHLLIQGSFTSSEFGGTEVVASFGSSLGSVIAKWGADEAEVDDGTITFTVSGDHEGKFGALMAKPEGDDVALSGVSSAGTDCELADVQDEAPAWAWEGPTGPSHWEEIGYPDCGPANMFQSPFNIQSGDAEEGDMVDDISHGEAEYEISQKAGVPTFTCAEEGTCGSITSGGTKFNLLQFHFHSYSEYALNGRFGVLGVHFVHAAEDGTLLVLGQIYQTSQEEHPGFAKFWTPENVAADKDDGVKVTVDVRADMYGESAMEGMELYQFQGSLTTPPCSGGVNWLFLSTPGNLSQAQVEVYRDHAALTNFRGENRPLQPKNDRPITVSTF